MIVQRTTAAAKPTSPRRRRRDGRTRRDRNLFRVDVGRPAPIKPKGWATTWMLRPLGRRCFNTALQPTGRNGRDWNLV
eukprot:8059965-Alexandrium_andersonii.AAC.1